VDGKLRSRLCSSTKNFRSPLPTLILFVGAAQIEVEVDGSLIAAIGCCCEGKNEGRSGVDIVLRS
jgi:hypothetical protein